MIWHLFFQPFIEYGFMRRALVVCLALSVSTTARRLPSAAPHEPDGRCAVARHFARRGGGVLLSGMSLLAMSIGGFIAGIAVALVAGWSADARRLKRMPALPDFILARWRWASRWCRCAAPTSTCCICCLAPFWRWTTTRRCLSRACASLTLIAGAFYRGLVSEAFDTAWLQVNARWLPGLLHGLFLALLVLNLVAGFRCSAR
jgi:zinc/manganese transport system permease protein